MKSASRRGRCYNADPEHGSPLEGDMLMYSAALPNYLKMPNNSRPYI